MTYADLYKYDIKVHVVSKYQILGRPTKYLFAHIEAFCVQNRGGGVSFVCLKIRI